MFKWFFDLFKVERKDTVRFGALPISVNAPLNARIPRMAARLDKLLAMEETEEIEAGIKRYQKDLKKLGVVPPTNPEESQVLLKKLGV